MEPGAGETRSVQESSGSQSARNQKTLGFATTSGQDYEVALCSLVFLRALRHASDFFLVSNHAQAGKFDDVVLFYRLQGDQDHKYRGILLQAKHRDRVTQKKLTASNPFRLKEYLESFKEVRRLSEQPVNVESRFIGLQEVSLVLYTNTSCEIGNAAVDVTNFPEVQHIKDFLNTGGRLLQISEPRRVGLPQEEESSDFLAHLTLCTEQVSVETADSVLEEELSGMLKLTSPEVARNLKTELKSVVREWWSEGKVRFLTAESTEWKKVLELQVSRLNGEFLNIDRQLSVEFTPRALEQSNDVHRRLKLSWICVRDEHQANAVKSRLFRAQRNSLVTSVKSIEGHLEQFEALWGKNICSTLILDMSNVLPEEASPTLQRLQEEAVQSDAGRHLVVIATEEGKPPWSGWTEVDAEPTWSVLHQVTRDRLLALQVQLQGTAVALGDVVGGSQVHDVMTDQVIRSVCDCDKPMKLGEAMPAPLRYYVPRCLQRTPSKTIKYDFLQNTNTLIFSSRSLPASCSFKTLSRCEIDAMEAIQGPTFVEGISNDYDMRQLCFRFRVQGVCGEVTTEGLQGNVNEFFPFTWLCEEKLVVVEGPPGVGKSSFVTAMCSSAKEQFPEAWVLRIDMGRHTDYIRRKDFREVSDVKEFLLKCLPKDPDVVERRLLEHSLTVTGNVFLFLDAFDEISPDFTGKCCHLLKNIAQTIRYRQMVVTTRPVTVEDVEEALQTKAFSLPVFSEEEQVLFLKRFSAAKGKQVDEEEISSLLQSGGSVLEIPLLCGMAAEVLLHRRDKRLLNCQNPWRRVLLYEIFVEQSVKKCVAEKFGLDTSRPGVNKILESNEKQHLWNLQGLAVRKLMPVAQLPPLTVSRETPEEKLGLVVDTGNGVDFEHQTFAEYFLGRWLARHWSQCPQRQLLRDVLLPEGFELVAATLSWSLFDGYPLHVAVAQGDEDLVRTRLSPGTTDRGGRTALHVAAMTQGDNRRVWELLVASGEDLNTKDDVLGKTAVRYAEISGKWEVLESILEEVRYSNLKYNPKGSTGMKILNYIMKKDHTRLCQYVLRTKKKYVYNFDDEGNTLLHMAAANNSCGVMEMLINMRLKLNVRSKNGYAPLHQAAGLGHVQVVRLLAENGAEVNLKDMYGNTALTWAAREGHQEVVDILIQNGADLNIKDGDGNTALTLATWKGHLEVMKLLIQKGAVLDVRNKYGNTALTMAASDGHLEVMRMLIGTGADFNIKNKFGHTALTLASREGHQEVVKMLIGKGVDLNIRNEDGNTALTEAASEGHQEVVQMLLGNGADLNVSNEGGDTALTLAADEGHQEVVKMLLGNGADLNVSNEEGDTALTLAAYEGHLEVVKMLIEKGADLGVNNQYGRNAITLAAFEGHEEAVKVFIEKGVDLNVKDDVGDTALTQAAYKGHLELVKMLTEKGADLHIKDNDGASALTWAARQGHLEVVKVLIENGADLNAQCNDGCTALAAAAWEGHLKVVKLLIEEGAHLNMKNELGHTALTLAARENHLEVVKILTRNGANLNVKNLDDVTPLTWAALKGHSEVVKVLIEKGADVNVKNKFGHTALALAVREGHLEVAKVIENARDLNVKKRWWRRLWS